MNVENQDAAAVILEMNDVAVPSARSLQEQLIQHVNWRVRAGEYWVVAGLQGSGKTALTMMMAGLIAPHSGSYMLFGEPMPILEGERLETRLRLGLVFEEPRLFNHLTVAENIALPIQYHRRETPEDLRTRVDEILDATGLAAWASNTPGTLAWGWQKRVALARAIALQPELLLLDNPLGGTDPRHTSWWLNLMDDLSRGSTLINGKPVTLVVATHDLIPWKNRARQFAMVKHGEFEVIGSREELENSADKLAKQFLAHAAENI
jgi:ABC-type transporter Mla maintaining outer membrane lipid asymmetry ATPase subunit MlaF